MASYQNAVTIIISLELLMMLRGWEAICNYVLIFGKKGRSEYIYFLHMKTKHDFSFYIWNHNMIFMLKQKQCAEKQYYDQFAIFFWTLFFFCRNYKLQDDLEVSFCTECGTANSTKQKNCTACMAPMVLLCIYFLFLNYFNFCWH